MQIDRFDRIVVREEREVRRGLKAVGLTPLIVREVAIAAVSARAEALSVDPNGAPGLLSYIYGVRTIRLQLLPKGWRVDRSGNVEATVNDELGVQLFFQNVDRACAVIDPNAISCSSKPGEFWSARYVRRGTRRRRYRHRQAADGLADLRERQ
jgi:hypothetical protein